jgi:diacylglycerol kinase family enzyme
VKTKIIVNPSAGGGKGKKLFPALVQRIQELGLPADCVLSSHPKEALDIAMDAPQKGYELVAACGGDGTIHSLLPAFVNHSTILGIIPLGGANDLARGWKIPPNPLAALEVLRKGQPQAVDVIEVHPGNYIAGAGGIGFDAAVVERANHLRRWWRGIGPFFPAVLLEFFRYQLPSISIQMNGFHYEGPAWQLTFSKISSYALLLKIQQSPVAFDDGSMKICLIPDMPKTRLLISLPSLLFSGLRSLDQAQFFSATKISITSSSRLPIQGDGELVGHTPAELRVLSKALRVMMPVAA